VLGRMLPRADALELAAGHNSPAAAPEHFVAEWQKFQQRANAAGSPVTAARPAELAVLGAVGMRQVMRAVTSIFERQTGHRLAVHFDSGADIARRVQNGEAVDVVVIPRGTIDELARAGKIDAASVVDVAMSTVALAIRKGAPRPDISSPEALRRTLLRAKSIARPDPARGGSSGVHIAQVLQRLGVQEQLRSRTILASNPEREEEMPGAFVAAGRAEIALHQIQELMAVPGIEVIGPLPGDLGGTFLFSGGILTGSGRAQSGQQLLQLLTSPDTLALIKRKGMGAPPR
jgi:molybdate transport system substrate-binding protein